MCEVSSLAAASPRNRGRAEARRRRPAAGESGSFPFGPCLSGGISGKFSTPQTSLLVLVGPLIALGLRRRRQPWNITFPMTVSEQTAEHFRLILRP